MKIQACARGVEVFVIAHQPCCWRGAAPAYRCTPMRKKFCGGEAALVTKISGSSTSLCLVNGTRIALNHRAAMNILVERLPANAQ